ncbi:hypothetical protein BD324DRAFT_617037 [Kockovaella imperatae]|uniref:Yeast cell wall synthesis Kre9/Knh1-like N-terminal domain-containing protein n=1 Tax=Kockovaella imperatae TaxID=4999 RepID=A0A1Y1UQD2_9TREE|nr:hypothetical protein BD324DRAFT_617037 [Kockovaella imperatae]ORX40243.1 hypothetical protein BD324DRAFT_617037 [Kockovaella imperatae]
MKYTLAAILTLAISAVAVQVTFPSETEGWETNGSQLVEWKSVSTDPTSCDIELTTPNNNTPTTIAKNVSVAEGSYIYTPSSPLQAGNGYRLNLVASGTISILAQSPQFNVTQGTSTVTPTSGMSQTSTSATHTSTTTSMSASASASHTSGAATHLTAPVSGLALLILGAVGAMA